MKEAVFELVVVCTGNRARSPIAEALLREHTTDLPVELRSVGTLDLGSLDALPEAVQAASELGLDLSAHRTRRLEGDDLSTIDLVLGFERMHVMSAVVSGHAQLERTFTLPELVGLLETDATLPPARPSAEHAPHAIARAHARRPADLARVGLPEVADPLGRPPAEFRATAETIRDLITRLASLLFGV